jgi:hypothetical protein
VAAFGLNLLALLLVVGISWLAMMWLTRWVHRHNDHEDEVWGITRVDAGDPCPECDGIGARRRLGRIEACGLCEGKGEITSLSG